MTVYVDNHRRVAKVGRVTATWSHLTADTATELHRFARHLGLRRAWVQHEGLATEHYVVTEPTRRLAQRIGAQPVISDLPAAIGGRSGAYRERLSA